MITLSIREGRLAAHGATPEDRERLLALRDLWEERAAILEFDAGFTRAEAEAKALEEIQPLLAQEAA